MQFVQWCNTNAAGYSGSLKLRLYLHLELALGRNGLFQFFRAAFTFQAWFRVALIRWLSCSVVSAIKPTRSS